jgi:hypothetical protein
MILARLSRAIRRQNWFAVALEFLIVILGVVIGFQVTAWNAERLAQAEVSDLLVRLHDEIVTVEDVRHEWRDTVRPVHTLETLQDISPLLLGENEPDRRLTDVECRAIAQSHILSVPPQVLPILDELEATGSIRLITDDNIRSALTHQQQRFERTQLLIAQMNVGTTALPTEFSSAIWFVEPEVPRNWIPYFDGTTQRDLAAMRADRAFLNRYADYVARYYFYIEVAVLSTDQRLEELHSAVDATLGMTHPETEE